MVRMEVEGSELVIRLDVNSAGAISKSGKSHILGTTNGFVAVATPFGVVKVGLNVITSDDNWKGGKAEAKPAQPTLVKRA